MMVCFNCGETRSEEKMVPFDQFYVCPECRGSINNLIVDSSMTEEEFAVEMAFENQIQINEGA